QSTNEELETMNEELQSTNEELETTNTELRMRSDELNTANAFLGSILTGLEVGVVVVDPKLQVLAWNHRAEDMWGLRSDEVQGRHFMNLDIGLPVEKLLQPVRAVLAGDTGRGALAAEQGELERAVERVTAEAATLRAERDDARTETARAELHLTAARQVLEDGPDGYIVTDDTGIILQANRAAAQLLGVPLR